MAYYDPVCIPRLRLIRRLKSHHRLSLSEIKKVLEADSSPVSLEAQAALKEAVFGAAEGQTYRLEEFCRAAG